MFKLLVLSILLCSIGTTLGQLAAETTEAPPPAASDMETAQICNGAYNRFKHAIICLSSNSLRRASNTNPQTIVALSVVFIIRLLVTLLTKKELLKLLNIKKEDELPCVLGAMKSLFIDATGIEFYAAVDVGVDVKYNVTEEFKENLLNYAFGEVISVNFTDFEEALAQLSDLSAAQTNNYITDIIPAEKVNSDTQLVFQSAVYFAGVVGIFNESLNYEDTFYETPCKKVIATYVTGEFSLRYTDSAEIGAYVLQIPFRAPNYNLLFFLPYPGISINNVLKKIKDHKVFCGTIDKLTPTAVNVSIPTIDISFVSDFRDILIKTNTAASIFDTSSAKNKNVVAGNITVPFSVGYQSTTNNIIFSDGEPSTEPLPSNKATFIANRPYITYVMIGGIPTNVLAISTVN